MTTLILVRHGQTAWNRVERFRGQADVPLDDVGIAQAARTRDAVASRWKPSAIYASPLSRTMATASAIAEGCSLVAQPHAGLLDINYGAWQGLTPEEAARRWPTEVAAWYRTPAQCDIPGGEPLTALSARGMAAVGEIVARHAEGAVVLVGHTVINRVLILSMLGVNLDQLWRLRQDPCAINVIEAETGSYTLVTLNDTCHLRA